MARIISYNPNLKQLAKKLRKDMTFGEVLLWNELREDKLWGFDFDRQRCIDNYIVDFYCKELMLAVEIDGGYHNSEEQFAKDNLRQQSLEEFGVMIVRFSEAEVKADMLNVLRTLEAVVLSRVKELPSVKLPKNFNLNLLSEPLPNPPKGGNSF